MNEAIATFLETLSALAQLKTGGVPNDLSRLLHLGAVGVRVAAEGKTGLEEATAKVQQLVSEDRGLTDDENAAIDASINRKLKQIADTVIDNAGDAHP